ncbi:hypothetical protein DOY81_004465 [Sarcophaga bullata]|nr:hypothetical protein DOY81_004465 [Sarcophaga bullata]
MKLFYLLSLLFCITSVMGMPQKVALAPLSSEEEYGTIRGSALQNIGSIRDRYPIYVLGPYHNEDRQNPKLNTIRAYFNTINADSIALRKFLLSKLAAQCANQTKSLANHICNHVVDNDYDHIYFTVSPEIQLTNDFSKIKKNFDEIDKTSASFSTLNQLI